MSLCRVVEFSKATVSEFAQATTRAKNRGKQAVDPLLSKTVSKIIERVRSRGWRAALTLTRRFDAPNLKASQFEVKKSEIKKAEVPKHQHQAILNSIERVIHFHEAQLTALTKGWEPTQLAFEKKAWQWTMPASSANPTGYEGQRLIPLESVGVYVPGGKADYPSSVIMNTVPAKVAGVQEFVLCTPPRSDGSISPAVLVAARELGIEHVIKCGGAQAIALMALGPEGDLPNKRFFKWHTVAKVVGPGNMWVNEAKRQLWGQVGVDTFAGPSEVCVLADDTANPAFAAADWLSQIEHAPDNVGYFVATSREVADSILVEAEKQLKGAPREAIMRHALADHGLAVIIERVHNEPAITTSALAAEHVTLMVKDTNAALHFLTDGGCVLVGDYTPQSAGDFCSGPSHTLPTGGAARFGSPVNVMDFLKFQSISCLTRDDLELLRPTIEAFGEMEGFPQHARGATIRFEDQPK